MDQIYHYILNFKTIKEYSIIFFARDCFIIKKIEKKYDRKNQNQLKKYDVIRIRNVIYNTKSNMNIISVHEYVQII